MSIDTQSSDAEITDEAAEATVAAAGDEQLLTDELLVEEVSIDGMCGVY